MVALRVAAVALAAVLVTVIASYGLAAAVDAAGDDDSDSYGDSGGSTVIGSDQYSTGAGTSQTASVAPPASWPGTPTPSSATTAPSSATTAPSASSAGPAPSAYLYLPDAYTGIWEGIEQASNGDVYPIALVLQASRVGGVAGGSTYSTYGCRGEYTLTSGGDNVRLSERMYQGNCVNRQWWATLRSDGLLELKGSFLSYDGTLAAALRRVR